MRQLTELSLLAESVKASWNTYFGKVLFSTEEGWALAATGLLYFTSDGGTKWTAVDSDKSLSDMCFLDNGSGFCSKQGRTLPTFVTK